MAEDLSDVVERHWIVEWDLPAGMSFTQALIPHPCVNIAFESGRGAVFGIPSRGAARTLIGRGSALGIKFRPGGFAAFTTLAMTDLRDRVIPLEQLYGPAGREVCRAVAGAPSEGAKLAATEAFLRAARRELEPGQALVQMVVVEMLAAAGTVRVAELARAHGVSPRSLQRLFRRYVGVSPKWALTRYRVQAAAERIALEPPVSLAELAQDAGFSDQAHFTRAFRGLVGQTPRQYALACRAAAATPDTGTGSTAGASTPTTATAAAPTTGATTTPTTGATTTAEPARPVLRSAIA